MRFVSGLVVGTLLLTSVQRAPCQTIINTDATINTNRTDMIIVDDGINPAHQTTVNIIDPAYTHAPVEVVGHSILNIQGGTVARAFSPGISSTINVSGGHVLLLGDIDDYGGPNTTLNVSGGLVDTVETEEHVFLTGGSITNLTLGPGALSPHLLGGTIQNMLVSTSLDLEGTTSAINTLDFGGRVLNLNTSNLNTVRGVPGSLGTGTVNILGGVIDSVRQGTETIGTINLYAGQATGLLEANRVNFYGGEANDLISDMGPTNMYGGLLTGSALINGGSFNLYGGTANFLIDPATITQVHYAVNVYGGSVGELRPFYDTTDSVFNIYGGNIGAIQNGSLFGTFNFYGNQLTYDGATVQGILSDGSAINLSIPNGDVVHLFATPEPGNCAPLLSLCLVGSGFVHRRRTKDRV